MSNKILYIEDTKTRKVYENITIKNLSTKEVVTIKIANIDTQRNIQWNLIDNSKVWNTTKVNYFTYSVGGTIRFYRRSDPSYEDVWEVTNINYKEKSKTEIIYSYQ